MSSSIFAGNSRFSSDFSQVIERSLGIASLPLKLLQQQKADTDNRTAALLSVKTKVGTLQSSVQALVSAFGSSSFTVASANENAASVTAGAAATSGSWKVKVTDVGATTSFVVAGFPAVTDPGTGVYTSSATQTLLVDLDPTDGLNDPEVITLSPPGNTLQSLVDEINKQAGSRVQAAVVNVGTTAAPQYQLSLQSRTLGPVDITFKEGAIESKNTVALRGSLASYNVNGIDIATDSRTVTIAPDVTLDLKTIATSPFVITVGRNTAAISMALGNFANAWNTVSSELNSHRGTEGALTGDSLLNTTQSVLRQLLTAQGPAGSFGTLSDLGVGFNDKKQLYLDDAIFTKVSAGKIDELKDFFGALDSGGLVQSANTILDALTKTSSGMLSSALESNENAAKLQGQHISDQQTRIDKLEERLNAQMAAADATIAMLEQQVEYFTGMWKAMSGNRNN